jgi:hypothetical protein
MQNIPISKPNLGEREIAAVSEVIRGGMIAQGPKVAEFEARFAEMLGVKHAIATNNGTTALTVALMAHELGPDDEVIVPSFSFFATASSVLASGAKPVFADIDPHSFNLDPKAAEAPNPDPQPDPRCSSRARVCSLSARKNGDLEGIAPHRGLFSVHRPSGFMKPAIRRR